MKCTVCGSELYQGEQTCHVCGSIVNNMQQNQTWNGQNTPWSGGTAQGQAGNGQSTQNAQWSSGTAQGQTWSQQNSAYNPGMSKREFAKHPNMKKLKRDIMVTCICIYVIAGLAMIFSPYYLIGVYGEAGMDVPTVVMAVTEILYLIFIVGGALVQFLRSRVAAIVMEVFAATNTILSLSDNGKFAGIIYVLLAASAIQLTFRYHKMWDQYRATGVMPDYYEMKMNKKSRK